VTDAGVRWQHHCDKCVFLGVFGDFDLYFDPRMQPHNVVARYGSLKQEWYSGLALGEKIPAIAEAKRRARARGLLGEVGHGV
jgi:hypothetical protein